MSVTLKYAQNVEQYHLRKLAADAKYRDDKDALHELTEINLRLVRESNLRLSRLERAGYTQYAYNLAQSYTRTAYKSNRFKGIEITDPNDLRKQISQMQLFLSKRTSFVSGAKALENARIEFFRDKYKDELKNAPPRKIKSFLKFIGNRTVRDFIDSNSYMSEEIVEAIYGQYKHTKKADLQKLFDNWYATEHGIIQTDDPNYLTYHELKAKLMPKRE